MEKFIATFLIISFLSISCSRADTPRTSGILADTSSYTILPYDTTGKNLDIFNNCMPAELVVYEFAVIDTLLNVAVNRFNELDAQKQLDIWKKSYGADGAELSHFKINLKNYKRQYIIVVSDKEEKEVWVNCFKEDEDPANRNPNWRNEIMQADGGGMKYFQLKINLTTRHSSEIKINEFE